MRSVGGAGVRGGAISRRGERDVGGRGSGGSRLRGRTLL